jgi:hypothetical protein
MTQDSKEEIQTEIRDLLRSIDAREESKELDLETDSLFKEKNSRANDSLKKVRSTFDRIHDKLFTFNNIMIAAFLGLSKYPSENPIFELWVAFLPICNLIFLMVLEKMQMEIYRHEALEMKWVEADRDKYGKMIDDQNMRSLVAIIVTFSIFIYLFISIAIF